MDIVQHSNGRGGCVCYNSVLLMKAVGIVILMVLWIVSLPCTVIVIIFQLAKDNADKIYSYLDSEDRSTSSEPKQQTFDEKLEERMRLTKNEREQAFNERKKAKGI